MTSVLLISKVPPNNASTIAEHVNAIVQLSQHDVTNVDVSDANILTKIEEADCILLHYSVVAYPYRSDNLISSEIRLCISSSGKPTLHIVQDEQRNVLERFRYFESLGIKHVFSVAPEKVINKMYPSQIRSFSVSTLLTGYIPLNLDNFKPKDWDERRIDISYRARRLPNWYGNLGLIKSEMAEKLNEFKKETDLFIDASCEENDRIYGQNWINFLCDSKVAVGTESGSSILDMDGRFLEDWQNESILGSFDSVEPLEASYSAISPRIFEYAAAKCLLALTPGYYSGILEPGTHYFELKTDLSNISDLLLLMNDESRRNMMIKNAYEHLVLSGDFGYAQMVSEVDFWLSQCFRQEHINNAAELGKMNPTEISRVLQDLDSRNVFNRTRSSIYQFVITTYQTVFNWSLSRKGNTRNLLRKVFRLMKTLFATKGFTTLRFLLEDNSFSIKEFKSVFLISRNLSESIQLIPELLMIKHEAKLLENYGLRLRYAESEKAIWISWPESPFRNSNLACHPKLDFSEYPDSKGVWFTRSDYSENTNPLYLDRLSHFYLKDTQKLRRILGLYLGTS